MADGRYRFALNRLLILAVACGSDFRDLRVPISAIRFPKETLGKDIINPQSTLWGILSLGKLAF
jgi:hypothetical protein